MPRLPFASGSGSPTSPKLTAEQIRQLAAEFRRPLAEGWQAATQEIIDQHVEWYWCQFTGETGPMHTFYEAVAQRFEELAVILQRGPESTHPDVLQQTKILFDQRARAHGDDTFAKLPSRLKVAGASFRRADEHLRTIELPSSTGPQVDERTDILICRLADMVERHGGRATASYSSQKGKHDSPFVRFTNRVYDILPEDARPNQGWSGTGPLTSRVRRVLEKRKADKQTDQR